MKKYKVRKRESYPSLYEAFELGDRVKRVYKDGNGMIKEFRGIILAIEDNCMEVYWDTEDGKYRPPTMDVAFTNCSVDEIFNGDKNYSPIEKQ